MKPSGITNGGNGVFTVKSYKVGETVLFYCGVMEEESQVETDDDDYSIYIEGGRYKGNTINPNGVDKKWGLGAYINDSYGTDFYNNVKFNNKDIRQLSEEENIYGIGIVAIRDISAGAELFINYGLGYWRSRPEYVNQ